MCKKYYYFGFLEKRQFVAKIVAKIVVEIVQNSGHNNINSDFLVAQYH
jgi:hypothetical protein